jgi:hypothetical protein
VPRGLNHCSYAVFLLPVGPVVTLALCVSTVGDDVASTTGSAGTSPMAVSGEDQQDDLFPVRPLCHSRLFDWVIVGFSMGRLRHIGKGCVRVWM